MTSLRRIIVGITGASGAVIGIRSLELLKQAGIETHLIMTAAAAQTAVSEVDLRIEQVKQLADVVHSNRNVGATIASGSFQTMGMIVAPCSVKTLSEIAYGITSSLLPRAADVCLKERRRLVLMVRETPLHAGHLRAMAQATENGAIIMPPVPAFYARPASIDEMVTHSVSRALDLFGIETGQLHRWEGSRMSAAEKGR